MTAVPTPLRAPSDLDGGPIGSISEAMYVMESDEFPRSGSCMMHFRGSPDIAAFENAVRHVQGLFPSLVCVLREEKIRGRYHLVRVPMDDPPGLRIVRVDGSENEGRTPFEIVSDVITPLHERRLDLFREAPAQFILVALPHGMHSLVVRTHHACADGATVMGLFQQLFARYHQIVTGERPDWADGDVMGSSVARMKCRTTAVGHIREMMREGRVYKKHPVLRLCDPATIHHFKRHVANFTMDTEESTRVVKTAKAHGITVNDWLCVCLVRTIDGTLGNPDGTQSLWIPVNVRPYIGTDERFANFSSSINVDLVREERLDEKRLIETFVSRRKAAIEGGRAYQSALLLDRLMGFARFFPVARRTAFLRKMFTRPTTLMISNTGILWPKKVDGKLSPESALTHAGGLDLVDYAVNFSTDESLGYALVAQTFNSRFSVFLSAYEDAISFDAATRFLADLRGRLAS